MWLAATVRHGLAVVPAAAITGRHSASVTNITTGIYNPNKESLLKCCADDALYYDTLYGVLIFYILVWPCSRKLMHQVNYSVHAYTILLFHISAISFWVSFREVALSHLMCSHYISCQNTRM